MGWLTTDTISPCSQTGPSRSNNCFPRKCDRAPFPISRLPRPGGGGNGAWPAEKERSLPRGLAKGRVGRALYHQAMRDPSRSSPVTLDRPPRTRIPVWDLGLETHIFVGTPLWAAAILTPSYLCSLQPGVVPGGLGRR
ncbi:hypothetical protein LZ30DRAFT_247769 [Colletotrichum cereale]|nr:hypothetical protein LZ30DRAFT_247769 [Colletotrichum cereale]